MSSAPEILRRKADDYRALGSEHERPDGGGRLPYDLLELILRELADALENVEDEIEEAA